MRQKPGIIDKTFNIRSFSGAIYPRSTKPSAAEQPPEAGGKGGTGPDGYGRTRMRLSSFHHIVRAAPSSRWSRGRERMSFKARSHSCDRVRPRETRPVFKPLTTS